jgi:hypothetical protein
MTRDIAERVNQLFLECAGRLDEMRTLIRQYYPPHEMSFALQDLAATSGHLLMVLKAVYDEYRDLMPPQLRPEQRDQTAK